MNNEASLVLTESGAIYLEGAWEVLKVKEQVYEKIRGVNNKESKKWRVGITTREGLNLFLEGARRFQENDPGVAFDIIEGNVIPISKMLEEGDLQMAIIVVAKANEIKSDWELLKREEIFLAIPNDWILKEDSVDIRDFAERKAILAKKGTAFRAMEEEILKSAGIDPEIAFEINNIEAAKDLVSGGAGFSFIPESMVSDRDAILYISFEPPDYRYHLLGLGKEKIGKEILNRWISILKEISIK